MLSAETASGQYPVETVEAMSRICLEAEQSQDYKVSSAALLDGEFSRIDQAISMAALFSANHLNIKVIAALTQSGSSALWMSRVVSGVPIYALTPEAETYSRLALFRDVEPVMLSHDNTDRESLLVRAESEMLKRGIVQPGDPIAFTFGDVVGLGGGTNCLKIVKAGFSGR